MTTFFIVLVFALALWRLLVKLNSGFPIFELTVVLYTLQYLIAPLFDYNFNFNEDELMTVPPSQYLDFTFLAILAFALGLFSLRSKLSFAPSQINNQKASLLGRTLIFIGLCSKTSLILFPGFLTSTLHLLEMFFAIGIYALVFSKYTLDKILVVLFSIALFIHAIIMASLMELVVSMVFLGMFLSLKYHFSIPFKLLTVIISFALVSFYQGFKIEYREATWNKDSTLTQKISALDSLINQETLVKTFNTHIKDNRPLLYTMHRLNQGWQTSMVYKHVPREVEYRYGIDFLKDLASPFVPRMLWENKRIANDQERFRYYTGHPLKESTIMTIGVVGDFYLNFGKIGTVIAMFGFGFLLAWLKRALVTQFVNTNPINLIWIPFVFSYLIRPDNEFYMVFNHIVKSIIILLVMFVWIYPILGIQNKKIIK